MAANRSIVLFTRSPEEEASAKRLPRSAGARLFWSFLESWRTAAAQTGAELLVVAPPGAVTRLSEGLAGPFSRVEVQRGTTFGERLADATERAFDRGGQAVLLVGGDSPAPSPAILCRAFSALESDPRTLVLGPAADGGVNLIGLAQRRPELLTSIAKGSSRVERTLTDLASTAGLEVLRLPSGRDLDRIEDIATVLRICSGKTLDSPADPSASGLDSADHPGAHEFDAADHTGASALHLANHAVTHQLDAADHFCPFEPGAADDAGSYEHAAAGASWRPYRSLLRAVLIAERPAEPSGVFVFDSAPLSSLPPRAPPAA